MCFNFKVSLGTFLFSWAAALYLLNTKTLSDKQTKDLIFLMIFSSMQLTDAILWLIGMKKNNVNYIVTSLFIPLILCTQVIYNLYFRNNIRNNYVNFFIIIGVIYTFIRFNGYSISSCKNKLSSPIWGSHELKLWEMILFASLICYPNWSLAVMIIIFSIILTHFISGGYGSMWCALGNLYALYYLLIF